MDKCKGCIHDNVCNRDVGYGWLECPHFINTADVISRAEAARLQSQINRLKKYDEERDIALHAELIANTRQEVAKEIFEEIENKIGIGHDVIDIFNILAELKKKYTEE